MRVWFLEVFTSFVFLCVCAQSWVWWHFQGWVHGANPLSGVSLPLRQQPEMHLDNWGQLWQHCQVTQVANNIIIHAYSCACCIFGINENRLLLSLYDSQTIYNFLQSRCRLITMCNKASKYGNGIEHHYSWNMRWVYGKHVLGTKNW